MSKAFTREGDDVPEPPVASRLPSLLPEGATNYMTPDGAQALRDELAALVAGAKEKADAAQDPATSRALAQEREQRIRAIQQSLRSAVIVDRLGDGTDDDRVRLGAVVTVRRPNGEEAHLRVVGVDQADADRGWVSFLSPLGRALLEASVGDTVQVTLPSGVQQLEILGAEWA